MRYSLSQHRDRTGAAKRGAPDREVCSEEHANGLRVTGTRSRGRRHSPALGGARAAAGLALLLMLPEGKGPHPGTASLISSSIPSEHGAMPPRSRRLRSLTVAVVAIALYASRKEQNEEDYFLAGRRLT
jgi:hypothetical protein